MPTEKLRAHPFGATLQLGVHRASIKNERRRNTKSLIKEEK